MSREGRKGQEGGQLGCIDHGVHWACVQPAEF